MKTAAVVLAYSRNRSLLPPVADMIVPAPDAGPSDKDGGRRHMGHQHLGTLPRSRKWRQVIQLISGGADVQDVAAATSIAAENQMADASNDPAVKHAVWLLTQIPIAARKDDFAVELTKL